MEPLVQSFHDSHQFLSKVIVDRVCKSLSKGTGSWDGNFLSIVNKIAAHRMFLHRILHRYSVGNLFLPTIFSAPDAHKHCITSSLSLYFHSHRTNDRDLRRWSILAWSDYWVPIHHSAGRHRLYWQLSRGFLDKFGSLFVHTFLWNDVGDWYIASMWATNGFAWDIFGMYEGWLKSFLTSW